MYQSLFIRLLAMLMLSSQIGIQAQNITQTIRGSVVDLETNTPLQAATVAVYIDSAIVAATISDADGHFRIENIPVGRYSVVCSFIGYRQSIVPDVIANSVKEVILTVQMEESPLEIEEIRVSATGKKGSALNKLAYVSARTFSVEESERYAGSRGDPARWQQILPVSREMMIQIMIWSSGEIHRWVYCGAWKELISPIQIILEYLAPLVVL